MTEPTTAHAPASDPGVAARETISKAQAARTWVADMGRYLGARVFVAMADHLPRNLSEGVISSIALAETAATRRGAARRREGRLVFGLGRRAAWRSAWRTTKVPYQDLIDVRRISTRRDDLTGWTVEEVNREVLDGLLETRQPFLAVGGHFTFAAMLPLARTFPDLVATGAVDPIEPFQWRGDVLLRRLMMGTIHGLGEVLRPGATNMAYVGESDVQGELLKTLSQPGGIGYIAIDINWRKPNAYVRPFCGYSERRFALGAARIARLAQVPTVMAVGERTGLRSSRVHYFGPFTPAPAEAVQNDRAQMDVLVDQLERLVGRFREQYPHPVGWERRWDASTQSWAPFD